MRWRESRVRHCIVPARSRKGGARQVSKWPQFEPFGSKLLSATSCCSWKLLIRKEFWLREKDLNLRPLGYEWAHPGCHVCSAVLTRVRHPVEITPVPHMSDQVWPPLNGPDLA